MTIKVNDTLSIATIRHCHFKIIIERIAYLRRPVIVAAKSYAIIKLNSSLLCIKWREIL